MSRHPEEQNQSGANSSLGGAKRASEVLQIVLGLAGAVTAVVSYLKQQSVWFLAAGVVVVAASALWYAALKWRRRRRPPRPTRLDAPSGGGAYLRGLLPFEQGEHLLGRERDIQRLLAKVTNSEFRFGYVSGEAGAGKTSLFRAGLVPELRKLGQLVVYVPRLGEDPPGAISKALRQEFGELDGGGGSLHDAASAAVGKNHGKRLLIICDQFDEFCIAHRTVSARAPLIAEIGDCYNDGDLPVGFLLGLRKEFVDDLQDFSSRVPQPLDSRYRHRLRNWEASEARAVLDAAAEHDQVPFAEVLKEAIVRDLEQAGEVRPVELQLVATRLGELRIYEMGSYKEAGGASGILSSYVKEVIEPAGEQTPELDRQVARHLLRSLCAENADAKRPAGLRFEDLAQQVRATLVSRGQGDLIRNTEQYEAALTRVLRNCQSAYLVIQEDEQTYNLIHDYIVRSIRAATADIETVEEQANRLLDQCLEDERRHVRQVIPFRHYRFIRRYASKERKVEPHAALLLRKTRRHLTLRATATATAAAVLLLTYLLPRGVQMVPHTFDLSHSTWAISPDRRLAVSLKEGEAPYLWQLDKPWESRTEIPLPFEGISISPHSKFLAGITKDGKVYVWRPEDKLTGESKPVLTVSLPAENDIFVNEFWDRWGDFSPNDEWLYVLSARDEFFLWQTGKPPGDAPALYHRFTFQVPSDLRDFPTAIFSPDGKYLALSSPGSDSVRLSDPENYKIYLACLNPFSGPPVPLDAKAVHQTVVSENLVFSHNEEWLAFTDENREVRVANLFAFPNVTSKVALAEPSYYGNYEVYFSPWDEWVISKSSTGPFYTWRLQESGSSQPQPLFGTEKGSGDNGAGVDFSADGRWAAGVNQNSNTYVWPLDKSPVVNTEPAIPEGKGYPVIKFSPKGDLLAACSNDGGVFIWKPGEKPNLLDPAARFDTQDITLLWGEDDRHIFTYGGSSVYLGEGTDKLQQVSREKSNVVEIAVTPDRRQLLVFGESHLSVIERKFYLWGIPLYTYLWPALAKPDEARGVSS